MHVLNFITYYLYTNIFIIYKQMYFNKFKYHLILY